MSYNKFYLLFSSAVFVLTLLIMTITPGPDTTTVTAGANTPLTALPDTKANEAGHTYIIRVVAADSQAPITNARVQVEIPGASKKQGRTDKAGMFSFTSESQGKTVRVHISVQAQGFFPLDDFRDLAQDTLIPLSKL